VIYDLYLRMDPIVGRVLEEAGPDALVVVMSDHGFKSYRRKFSLNTWLLDEGYLVLKAGARAREARVGSGARAVYLLDAVDWSRTNGVRRRVQRAVPELEGSRERRPATPEDESGIVDGRRGGRSAAGGDREEAASQPARTGRSAVLRCDSRRDVFHGERSAEAPDLVVGYNAAVRELGRGFAGSHPARRADGQPGRDVPGQPSDGARRSCPASCFRTRPGARRCARGSRT
jgi:hypothetical protein